MIQTLIKKYSRIALAAICATQLCWATFAQASSTEFAIIGDAGKTTSNAKKVRDSIIRQNIFHLIMPGDNLYSSTYQSVWQPWTSAGMNYEIVAIGNHNGGYKSEVSFFQMPGEYYSKTIEGARFLVLNSDNDSTGSQQAAWLDQQLSQANEEFIFLVYHHPSYTISKFHFWQEKANFQKSIRPIIWKYRSKLTALLVGHDHLASILHFNDLPVILSGAVQEVRKDGPVNNVQDGVKVQTAWYFDSTPHWARLSWDTSNGAAQVQYTRASDDVVTCTALLGTGQKAQLQADCAK